MGLEKRSGTMTLQILSRLPLPLPWLLIGEILYFTKVLILCDTKMHCAVVRAVVAWTKFAVSLYQALFSLPHTKEKSGVAMRD